MSQNIADRFNTMSFKHMAWAFNAHVGDPMAKLLLLALADRADKETGQCYPSLARLCQDTEMSMATVTRRLIFLEENKFIIRTQRDRTSTLYTLLLTESTPLSDRENPSLSQRDKPITVNLSIEPNILFEEFWNEYPRKAGKGQARIAFKGALKKATNDEIVSAVKLYALSCVGKEQQFIAHASTWLNGERWLDEVTTSSWGNLE
jgi:hypothetical protein